MSNYVHKDESKFLLSRLGGTQLVRVPFVVFRLVRLVFTGRAGHLDVVYL